MFETYHSRRSSSTSPGSRRGASSAICLSFTRNVCARATRVSPIHSATPFCTGNHAVNAVLRAIFTALRAV